MDETCGRCGDPVNLEEINRSGLWAWFAPITREHPNPVECWAADGRPYGRMHKPGGMPRLFKALTDVPAVPLFALKGES